MDAGEGALLGLATFSNGRQTEDWRAMSIYQLLTDRFADGPMSKLRPINPLGISVPQPMIM